MSDYTDQIVHRAVNGLPAEQADPIRRLDIYQIADDIAGLEGVTSTHTPVMPLGDETICIILIGRGVDEPVCWMSPYTLSHTIIGRGDARTKSYHDEVGLLPALSAILDRVDSGHYDLR